MTDLDPDVRDRAAQAAREAVVVGKPWEMVPEVEKAELREMVDAVAAVVAPNIRHAERERILGRIKEVPQEWDALGINMVIPVDDVMWAVGDDD